MSEINHRRIFLLAFSDAEVSRQIETVIQGHIIGSTIYHAKDGSEALSKMANVPPHVLILGGDLQKIEASKLITNVLNDKNFNEVSMIALADPPAEQTMVDEIVMGRVQFLGLQSDVGRMKRAISRALNFVSETKDSEFKVKFLSEGDILLREGDTPDFVYLLRHGRLQAYHESKPDPTNLGHVEPGEFVGEMAYISGEGRTANVKALTDSELIEIPMDHLDHVLYRKPAWAKALMSTLSQRIKRLNAARVSKT